MKKQIVKMTSRFFLTVAIMLGMLNLSKAQGIAGAIVLSEIKNCVQTSPTEIEFEYWIQNVATNGETQKLNAVTFGLNYNTAISTGTCSGSLVSLNPAFGPNILGSTNAVTNPALGYMRYNSGLELVANALVIPTAAPGLYFGKFKITSTVPFTPSTPLNFAFQAANAGVKARHLVNIFRNTNTTANGYVFTSQGVNNGTGTGAYQAFSTNAPACDHIYNTPTTVTACQSYSWNNTTYTTSGTYTSAGTPQASPCELFNTYDIINLTIIDPGPAPTPVNCWDNYVLNTTTCMWENTGSQPQQPPMVNCWDNFVFNTTTCVWDNTGSQPAMPPMVNCWDNFVFNTTSCAWDNTGSQPAMPPMVNCWDNFVFNTTSCAWDNTGSQPAMPPMVNCWDNFVFNTTSCAWDNTGSQPAMPPMVNCWDNFVFNTTSCAWDNTGSQPAMPPMVNCWDNFVFNTTSCAWDNTGSQPAMPPMVNCWDNFVFNTTSCAWDNTGSQPAMPPMVNCWDNFVFNTTSCAWDNTGSQPAMPPMVNCWDNFVFNTTSCAWDNTGSQPAMPPMVNCWDNFVFNTTSCAWDNTGSQPAMPPMVNCWDNFVFNTTSCQWDNTGSQPAMPPMVNCWDNFVFNTTSCAWDNTGSQPPMPPMVNCWDNFVFNTTSCAWDNTGTQPAQPTLACYETATFNTSTCQWDVTGTPGYNQPMVVTAAGSYNFCGTTYTTSGIYTCNTLNTNPCGYDVLDLTITTCTVAVTAANVNVCAGSTVDLNAFVSPAGGTFNVPNPSVFPNGTTPYTYNVVDANGCVGSASATINVATLQSVTGFAVTGSNGSSVSLSWNAVAGAAWYTIRYRVVGSGTWLYSSVNVPSTTKTIVGLASGTDYEFEIRANCNVNNQGTYGSYLTASTTVACPAPSNIVATPVVGSNGTKLLVTFTQPAATGWNVLRYRLASTAPSGTWSVISPAAAAGTTITGLTPNSAYEIQVQRKCTTTDISAWAIGSGTTGGNPSKGIEETVETYVSAVSIYPNPTRDVLNIEVTSAENASTVVKVFDMSGRLVKQVQANTEVGVNNLVIDLNDVSTGMYTVQVYENNKLTNVTKVNKQD